MGTKIKQNMLRKRAEKLEEVTDEMWKEINEENRFIVDEYFQSRQELSPDTLTQYKSGLRQFFWWVYMRCHNIPLYEFKKRDFLKYRSYLINHGLSSNSLNFKRSAVSSLCNFIENVYSEEDDKYENFRNFTRGLPKLPKNQVYEKIAVSEDEYKDMMEVLEEQEDYLGMAWLATAFNVGARRGELVQFKTEIIDYPHHVNSKGDIQSYRFSHIIRGKGAGRDGKPLRFMCNNEAIKYMKLWVENRGYEHEYIFTVLYGGEYKPLSREWANGFCANKLSVIAGRRINPHIFKASAITYLLEEGHDMKTVSKYIAHHNSVETTQLYDLREDEDERDSLFQ